MVVTDAAVSELRQFDYGARHAIYSAFNDLMQRPLHELAKVKQMQGGQKDYYILRPIAGVRVVFRQLDKTSPDDPTQYVIVQVLAATD